jgi:SAM-dependent methyltransferase
MLNWPDAPLIHPRSMSPDPQQAGGVGRPCPVCGRGAADEVLQKGPLRLVRCRDCSMVYADPVEPELASGRFYERLGAPFYLSPDKLEGDYAPVRFERELRVFRKYCHAGAVLDVGCSTGAFLFQLKSRWPGSYSVAGTDVTGAALDYAEGRGIEVIRHSFLDYDFGGRKFEAVTFWAVMEHLVEPGKFLSRAGTVLKPGGWCFVLVPNLKSLAIRLLGGKYRYIMPDHVNYFTAETLKRFASSEAAFDLVEIGSSHFNPVVILKDLGGGKERVADAERARLLKRTTAYKRNPLLKPVQWVYGAVERALGSAGLADNLFMVLRKRG